MRQYYSLFCVRNTRNRLPYLLWSGKLSRERTLFVLAIPDFFASSIVQAYRTIKCASCGFEQLLPNLILIAFMQSRPIVDISKVPTIVFCRKRRLLLCRFSSRKIAKFPRYSLVPDPPKDNTRCKLSTNRTWITVTRVSNKNLPHLAVTVVNFHCLDGGYQFSYATRVLITNITSTIMLNGCSNPSFCSLYLCMFLNKITNEGPTG